MNYFDPARPKVHGDIPQLLNDCSAVPSIYMEPEADGTWRLGVMVHTSARGYSYRHTHVSKLEDFAAAWVADPETVLRTVFGWDGCPEASPAPKASELSLEDLIA